MIKWLRKHHWLHDWGKWRDFDFYYQVRTCLICNYRKVDRLREY